MSINNFICPILMYHYIGEPDDSNDTYLWVKEEVFDRQMEFLYKRGFKSIDLNQLNDHLYNQHPIPNRSVLITFDDGHQSFADHAAPILLKYGYSTTMFLITSRIGRAHYLTWEQINKLQKQGHSFESHSHTHPIITKLTSGQARDELVTSKKILQKQLNMPINFYCYRGGHFNSEIQQLVKEAGYQAAVCSRFGYNTDTDDRYALKRIPIKRKDSLSNFSAKIYNFNHQKTVPQLFSRFLAR